MAGARLPRRVRYVLVVASRLIPGSARSAWVREWLAELEHAWRSRPAGRSAAFSMRLQYRAFLAVADAWDVRRMTGNASSPEDDEGQDATDRKRRSNVMDVMMQDLRTSLRALVRRPVFTLAAVCTIALGIGATTAVFSVVNALLLQPLPYAAADRLVRVWPEDFMANREVAFLREQSRTLDAVVAVSPGWLMSLTGIAEPEQVNAARVTGNLFAVLGARPVLGRTFDMEAEQPGAAQVVVLGHELWQRAFGADPQIVGRSIMLGGSAWTVVGVMPSGFEVSWVRPDAWIPLAMDPQEFTWESSNTAMVLGRLARDATIAAASAELGESMARMRTAFGRPDEWGRTASVNSLQDEVVGGLRGTLHLLLGAVLFLLLIAAANVANLLLVRAAERRGELAVRRALGARSGRILRLVLTESAWIGAAGGMLGALLAYGGVHALRTWLPADTPRLAEIDMDGTVLAACAAVTLLSAALFGAAPGVVTLRQSSAATLRHARTISAPGGRLRGALIAGEVALALALIAGATLMTRTLMALQQVDPGFQPANLLTMRLSPAGRPPDELNAWWQEVLDVVRGTPGVENAARVLHLPMSGRTWVASYQVEGRVTARGETPPRSPWQVASPGYFETAGIPLLRGRTLRTEDRAGSLRVMAVNQAFADAAFPGEDAIGRRVRAGPATADELATIVGVVGSVRHDSLTVEPRPEIYVAAAQIRFGTNALVIRTAGDPAALAPILRERIRAIDAATPISHVMTMDALIGGTTQRRRAVLTLLAAFAGIGLALGLVGIWGVVAFGVRERVREIGIRMALGAQRGAVTGLIVRQGLGWALAGILIGWPAAFAFARLLEGLVFGVSPADPATFTLIPIALAVVAALAAWLPARRAARIDPAAVLRE